MHARKKGTHPAYQRARAIGSALEAVIESSGVQGASVAQTRAAIPAALSCASKHRMKTGLSKQVCGRRKQERGRDSAGPENDSVKFYSRRAL